MQEQLLNSTNLKEKLKELGEVKKAPSNVQEWLNTVAHKHWLKLLPQERFTGSINEGWFQQKSQNIIFKQLIITPQFTSEVSHLIDFLNQNYQIKKDDEVIYKPLNKLNYLECQRQAQAWIDKINNKALLDEDTPSLKLIEELEIDGEKYSLYDLGSRQNLLREGKLMNNCISTYAQKTDDELKSRKFLSVRDSNNKSIVNIGLITESECVTPLEHETFIHRKMEETLEKRRISEISKEKYHESDEDNLKHYKEYTASLFEQRGFIYEVDEIKEKNNEILSNYEIIVQSFLNKILNKMPSKQSINISSICENCKEQMSFFELNDNKRQDIFSLPTHRATTLSKLDELSAENFSMIKYIPPSELNNLKNKINNSDFPVALDLMKKTSWINLYDYENETIQINGAYETLTMKNIKANSLSVTNSVPNIHTVFDSIYGFNQKPLEINIDLGYINSKLPSNISINKCTPLKLEISHIINEVRLLNLFIKDSKFQELTIKLNESCYYKKENDLLIRQNILGTIILVDSEVKKYTAPGVNLVNIDTKRGTLNNSNKSTVDITSFIKKEDTKKLNPSIDSLLDYSIKNMQFKKVILNPSIVEVKFINNDFSALELELPIIDKNLILLACQGDDKFKEKLLSIMKEDVSILQGYQKYKSTAVNQDFLNLLEYSIKEIKDINEKHKDDPNSINYIEALREIGSYIFKSNGNYLSGSQKEKLELTRDTLIENMEITRVNNSRTKLTNAFANNFLNLMVYSLEESVVFSEDLKSELLDILKKPSRLTKSLKKSL